MKDQYGRVIDYMRVSITDRCNLRCRYCMPDGIECLSHSDILKYEEILEICRAAAKAGIRKLKVTGGEPLVRLGCVDLIREMKAIPGIEQVTVTTNGVELGKNIQGLLDAGIDGINISLDTLDPDRFKMITGRDHLQEVLDSIQKCAESGVRLKLNSVLQRDLNADEWLKLLSFAEHDKIDVRFIEMMPIGYGKLYPTVENGDLVKQLKEIYPDLVEDRTIHGNGPAVYVRIPGWKGSIGFISAIHGKFCDKCNRIRLTSTGLLKPCLCYGYGVDLKEVLNSGLIGQELENALYAAVCRAIEMKPDQHCFETMGQGSQSPDSVEEKAMVSIGG